MCSRSKLLIVSLLDFSRKKVTVSSLLNTFSFVPVHHLFRIQKKKMASSTGKQPPRTGKRKESDQDFLKPPYQFKNYPSTFKMIPEYSLRDILWTEEEVRAALIQYVSNGFSYTTEVAENMTITGMIKQYTYHYILESFEEKRRVSLETKPYVFGDTDNPPSSEAHPQPWNIPLKVAYYKSAQEKVAIPNTSYVKNCDACTDVGVECFLCHKQKKLRCGPCKGWGYDADNDKCSSCRGSGVIKCYECKGQGFLQCQGCKSSRYTLSYLQLTAKWENHVDDDVYNESLLPTQLVKNAEGQCVFEQTDYKVEPVIDFFESEINEASKRLVDLHRMKYAEKLILEQRQKIRIVPVVEVNYSWKDNQSSFFVYGEEKKVHAPHYRITAPYVKSFFEFISKKK